MLTREGYLHRGGQTKPHNILRNPSCPPFPSPLDTWWVLPATSNKQFYKTSLRSLINDQYQDNRVIKAYNLDIGHCCHK